MMTDDEALEDFEPQSQFERHTIRMLHRILEFLEQMMTTQNTTQADIDTLAAQITSDLAGLQADADTTAAAVATIGQGVTDIQAEIAALQAANPTLDITSLRDRVNALDPAVATANASATSVAAAAASVAAIPPPAPAPAPTPAPGDTGQPPATGTDTQPPAV